MAIIEGMDDDVTLLLSLLVIMVTVALAWFSTSVREPLLEIFIIDGSRIGNLIQRLQDRGNGTANQQVQPAAGDRDTGAAPGGDQGQPNPDATDTGMEAEASASNETVEEVPLSSEHETDVTSAADASESVVTESEPVVTENVASSVSEEEGAKSERMTEGNHSVPSHESLSSSRNESSGQESETAPPSQNELRQRRVNFFSGSTDTSEIQSQEAVKPQSNSEGISAQSQCDSMDTTHTSNQTDNSERSSRSAGPNLDSAEPFITEEVPDGHIRVRLKYLDDRQRLVHVNPDDTIGQFKSRHFATEIAENLIVRFIYNGQELRQDATLQSYNVVDNSVIHCLLSAQAHNAQGQEGQDQGELDIGRWMLPLFGMILCMVWYGRVMYRNYFNSMSTLSLIGITFFYLMAVMATLRRDEQAQH